MPVGTACLGVSLRGGQGCGFYSEYGGCHREGLSSGEACHAYFLHGHSSCSGGRLGGCNRHPQGEDSGHELQGFGLSEWNRALQSTVTQKVEEDSFWKEEGRVCTRTCIGASVHPGNCPAPQGSGGWSSDWAPRLDLPLTDGWVPLQQNHFQKAGSRPVSREDSDQTKVGVESCCKLTTP